MTLCLFLHLGWCFIVDFVPVSIVCSVMCACSRSSSFAVNRCEYLLTILWLPLRFQWSINWLAADTGIDSICWGWLLFSNTLSTPDKLATYVPCREKSTNYFPVELYTSLQSSQYFTMAISDQSLTSNESLFLALTKNAYKKVGPHGHPDLNGSC